MGVESPAAHVPEEVLDYMRAHNTLTLATASTAGVPHAATYVYVSDGVTVYFCARPDTTTAQHIAQNPVVAFTIDDYNPDWGKIKGIQGSGDAHIMLASRDIAGVVDLFREKFPDIQGRPANISFVRINPRSVQFINNTQTDAEGQRFAATYHRDMVYNVFRELPPQQVETLMGRLQSMQVPAGEVIVRQGAPAEKFFIIGDGEVEVLREDNGAMHEVARLGSGQFFGEMAILRDMPRTATVRATRPTTLLSMDRDSFRGLVAQSLSTTENFDQVIQRRLDELTRLSGA